MLGAVFIRGKNRINYNLSSRPDNKFTLADVIWKSPVIGITQARPGSRNRAIVDGSLMFQKPSLVGVIDFDDFIGNRKLELGLVVCNFRIRGRSNEVFWVDSELRKFASRNLHGRQTEHLLQP